MKTPALCIGHWRGPRNALTSAGEWLPCLSAGYFHPKRLEGLWSEVRIRRRPSVPRRRRACHPLCPLGKSCPPVFLHGPKLSMECTAGSLVCSLGNLIIRFCKQMIVAGAFFFLAALGFSYLTTRCLCSVRSNRWLNMTPKVHSSNNKKEWKKEGKKERKKEMPAALLSKITTSLMISTKR